MSKSPFKIDNSGTSPEINYTTKTAKNQLGFTDFCVKATAWICNEKPTIPNGTVGFL